MNDAAESRASARATLGRRLAAVAAVFLLLVLSIMALNHYLLATVDPLASPALLTLAQQLDAEPENALLRKQLRELDLLARRAFFVRQWQIETGYYLLAGGIAVLLLGFGLAGANRARSGVQTGEKTCPGIDEPWQMATATRRTLAIGVPILLVLAALIAAIRLPVSRLPAPPADAPPATDAAPAPTEIATATPSVSVAPEAQPVVYWPSFRGAGGLGLAGESRPPLFWDGATGEGIRWTAAVPRPGSGSPAVSDGKVFLSGADETARELYAFDADTGALLWTLTAEETAIEPGALPKVYRDTGFAAPSPATDGRRVVALFATGAILCADTDGNRLWERHLGVPDNPYGHASSPVIGHGLVFVQYDHFGGAALLALDLDTGQTRWTTPRGADASWSTPILIEAGGRPLLIVHAAPAVSAYDARDGRLVWEVKGVGGEIGASAAYAAGRIFAGNQYSKLLALDADDGTILWETDEPALPDAASPVATERFLFLPSSSGVFTCLDAATGAEIWTHEFERGSYSSPILAANRVYWITEDGLTRIFEAAATFAPLSAPALGETVAATPAMAGERLYIRGATHLFCIVGAPPAEGRDL